MRAHKYCVKCGAMITRTGFIDFGIESSKIPKLTYGSSVDSQIESLIKELGFLKRENEMLLNAEKVDNKAELKSEYKRGWSDAEQEFKNRYGIPGNKSLIDHMQNQRRNLDILQKKYEKLKKEFVTRRFVESNDFIEGIHCGDHVIINK